jgi:LysR family transcriptional regulator for bpeEF and oprC
LDKDHLADLALFVKTAELGSFSATAAAMGLTPSAVSKALARLESSLGCRLFQRSSRSMTLSHEGSRLYDDCHVHLAAIEEAWALTTSKVRRPQGTLRVATPLTFGERVLAPALPEFLRRYPDISVDAVFIDRQVDLVDERFEAAIRLGPAPDARVVAVLLSRHRFITCASPAYLAAHGTPQTIDELAAHNCLAYVFSGRGEVRRWQFEHEGHTVELRPRGNLATDNASALLEAAVQGIGILQCPTYLAAAALRSGALVPLLPAFHSFGPPLHLLLPPVAMRSARVDAFAKFVKALCLDHDAKTG